MALRCAASRPLAIALLACLAVLLAPAAAGASQGSGVLGGLLGTATQAVEHGDTQLAAGAGKAQQTAGTAVQAAAAGGASQHVSETVQHVSETVQQTSSRVAGVVSGASQAIAPAAGAASQLVSSTGRAVEAAVGAARTVTAPGGQPTTGPKGVAEAVVSKVVSRPSAPAAQGGEGGAPATAIAAAGGSGRVEPQPPAAGISLSATNPGAAAQLPRSAPAVSGRAPCSTCAIGSGERTRRSTARAAYDVRAGAAAPSATAAATLTGSHDVGGEGTRLPAHLPGPGGLPAPAFAPLGGAGSLALVLACLLLVAFVPSAARRLRAYSDIAADLRHPLILDRPG
ncbi:MAG TPA: hypothetical protein VNV44_09235 [Solirubrobacteraceae bacterium]|nr:hypothetical protein [Solirubrobacteraceae bacterium]